MQNLQKEIISAIDEFLKEITDQYPNTKTFIKRKSKFFKEQLNRLISNNNVNDGDIEMQSYEVNILYIFL